MCVNCRMLFTRVYDSVHNSLMPRGCGQGHEGLNIISRRSGLVANTAGAQGVPVLYMFQDHRNGGGRGQWWGGSQPCIERSRCIQCSTARRRGQDTARFNWLTPLLSGLAKSMSSVVRLRPPLEATSRLSTTPGVWEDPSLRCSSEQGAGEGCDRMLSTVACEILSGTSSES